MRPCRCSRTRSPAEKLGDYVSRELFEQILESEEEHVDFIETQLGLFDKIGAQNFQQSWTGIGS